MVTPATATRNSHNCTWLGHLGQHDTNRDDPIYIVLPKVAKAKKESCVAVAGIFTGNIDNKCC